MWRAELPIQPSVSVASIKVGVLLRDLQANDRRSTSKQVSGTLSVAACQAAMPCRPSDFFSQQQSAATPQATDQLFLMSPAAPPAASRAISPNSAEKMAVCVAADIAEDLRFQVGSRETSPSQCLQYATYNPRTPFWTLCNPCCINLGGTWHDHILDQMYYEYVYMN